MNADLKIALFLGIATVFALAVLVDLSRELWRAEKEADAERKKVEKEEKGDDW